MSNGYFFTFTGRVQPNYSLRLIGFEGIGFELNSRGTDIV